MKNRLIINYIIFCFCSITIASGQGIDKPRYQVVTHRAGGYLGTINLELFPLIAPQAVRNFDSLVNMQFFDSTAFHRVVPGFVIQGGDPNSISGPVSTWGQGQPWQQNIPAEFSVVRHVRGILGAARDVDTNSANSQFYICVANATFLDGQYTVYGKVTEGMDIVDTIVSEPRDGNDVPLQKIEMFVTYIGVNDTVPDVPVLTFPSANGQGILNGNTFQWSNVDGAVLYTIQISTDSLFTNIVFGRNCGLNSTAVSLLQSATTYYWRVKSNNGGHESNYSPFSSFTTSVAAQLTYPPDLATNVPINPLMQWTVVPNVNSYRLQIATSDTFSTPTLVVNQGGITTTSRQVNLSPNTLYYWRVTFISSGAQGFYSDVHSFTTGTTIGIDETAGASNSIYIRNIYPIPASTKITVEMGLNKMITADVIIKNIHGQEVYIMKKTIEPNKSDFDVDVSRLKAGHYFLTVKSLNREGTRQFDIE